MSYCPKPSSCTQAEIHTPPLDRGYSLLDAFDDEHAARRRAVPDGLDGSILRRILPSLRFLRAIKSDHHKTILGRLSLYGFDLAATYKVMATVRLQGVRNFGAIFRKGRGVVDVNFRYHVTRRALGFLRMNDHRACEANHASSPHCQCQFVIRLHLFFSIVYLCEMELDTDPGQFAEMLHQFAIYAE